MDRSGEVPAVKSALREYFEAIVVAVVLAAFIITFVAQSYVVLGSSMEPTLTDGQRLLVDKLTYRFRPPRRGEIIVFNYPADPTRKFIKRVVGVPGDTVLIAGHRLILNGRPVAEPYVKDTMYGTFGPVTVPEGHVFVLGDNRNHSDDSRYPDVGPVPYGLIVGLARITYWPPGRMGLVRVAETLAAMP
ncbi:MAG: signal peptidase I [Firmicutes bacterium]|nr:signal peptidase I [Bacillota bacterium]